MAIFSKQQQTTQETKATTIISQGAVIKGDLELTAKLHIEGVVDGNIKSTNEVSIGKDGIIKGDLKASKLIVNGTFEGTAECDYIEIMKGGIIKGNITIKNITIENGGCFAGTSTLKEDKNDTIKSTKTSKN